jgi:hypothetical protein
MTDYYNYNEMVRFLNEAERRENIESATGVIQPRVEAGGHPGFQEPKFIEEQMRLIQNPEYLKVMMRNFYGPRRKLGGP